MSLANKTVDIRENRLHTILHYNGDAQDLNERGKKGELQIGNSGYEQCGNCQEGCAVGQVYGILDAALIEHAPLGCYATISASCVSGKSTAKARGKGVFHNKAICTNISERETIYGGTEILREAILEAKKRYDPRVIFVTTACVSGIVGDDVEGTARDTQDEIGVPVISISCEGFKSRIWSSGFDIAFNEILRIVREPRKKQDDLVNIFNFVGSDTFTPLLSMLNLRVNYLPSQTTVEELSQISEAACTATICETLATYIGDELERRYKVPQVKAAAPYCLGWTDRWMREVAKLTHRESLAEQVIQKENERIRPELEVLRKELGNQRVYVFAGDAYAHNMANIASDLGMEVVGMTTYHHDQYADTREINTLNFMVESVGNVPNYTVCNKQPYQVLKFLKALKPDILIVRHQALAVYGYKLGIPTIFEADSNKCVGYDGIIELGRRIKRVFQTRKLIQNISENAELPYTDWWMDEGTDPFYFEGEHQ
ncbi:MAG: nitrogenase [Peptococcaceae bacterium]|jgi:nitrogenase molybdenum-iron protein alpha chain|nr:nitrogenase [Peptococcaceae bacterium]